MPDWIPGLEKGNAVDVQFNLPIKFKMFDENTESGKAKKNQNDSGETIMARSDTGDKQKYETDVTLDSGFSIADQNDFKLTMKAIEMTMKEYDNSARLKIGTGQNDDKTQDEWLRHFEKALDELTKGLDQEESRARIRRVYEIRETL